MTTSGRSCSMTSTGKSSCRTKVVRRKCSGRKGRRALTNEKVLLPCEKTRFLGTASLPGGVVQSAGRLYSDREEVRYELSRQRRIPFAAFRHPRFRRAAEPA